MGEPARFFPPKDYDFLIAAAKKFLLPFYLSHYGNISRVTADPEKIRSLKSLSGQRVVLCPNHPTEFEPMILFHLSKMVGMNFNFLTAREVFSPPLRAWLLQRAGCYSIARGTADRPSFQMTRKLLAAGKKWIVMFPEGAVTGQNDTLVPFQNGVVQLCFWALEDLAGGTLPPLYLVPVFIKYRYEKNMDAEISGALHRLEGKLGIASADERPHYDRLYRLAEHLMANAEQQYGISPPSGASLDARLCALKESALERAASKLGVKLKAVLPVNDRVRILFNAAERAIHQNPDQGQEALLHELWRVGRLMAAYDGYVRETMSSERFLEIINRFEWEVFGKETVYGPKAAGINIGNPVDISRSWEEYQKNKSATVASITSALENLMKKA